MISHSSLEHDFALKRFASSPRDQKPVHPWHEVVRDAAAGLPGVPGLGLRVPEACDLGAVADIVGESLATLLLARDEHEIFTPANQAFVARIAREVMVNVAVLAQEQNPFRLDRQEFYVLIEKTLIDNNAYDIAKSLLLRRGSLAAEQAVPEIPIRVVRRNRQIVPWNEAKIEIAVRKSFLALHRDPAPATTIARAVTARALAAQQSFLHLEEIQDLVQEELMHAGQFKVAEAFIIYRAMRAAVRGEEPVQAPAAAGEPNRVVVVLPTGDCRLWDGLDLRRRIEFSITGLALPLAPDELEGVLRRSLHDPIAQADLDALIVRNAQALAGHGSAFGIFAARILLTFLYEEVLGWDIVRDGPEQLREFHRRCFAANLRHGFERQHLRSDILAAFDLDALAAALDPAADLELDFLGLQTLYDRFLAVDRTTDRHPRRLETPQFFWMRIAMELSTDEPAPREACCLAFYELIRSRRFHPDTVGVPPAATPRA